MLSIRLIAWICSMACGLVGTMLFSASARAENGWTFTGPESPVDPSVGPLGNLVATGPGGLVYYVYGSSELGSIDIYFMKSADYGETWTAPVKIDTDPPGMNRSTPYDLVANTVGDVYVFFLDNRGPAGGPQSVRANISHDAGETWLTEDVLVSGCCGASGFADATFGSAGTIYVTSGRDLFVSNDFGANWRLLRQYQHLISVCPDDQGNVYVAWGPPSDAFAEVSNDGGQTWSNPIFLNDSLADLPRISCDSLGNVYVVTLRHNGNGTFTPFAHVSNDSGNSYLDPVSLGPEYTSISGPSLAADCAGNVVTVSAYGPTQINRSHDFGRTWLLEPQLIEPADAFSVLASVDMTESGHVYLAYSSVRENGRKIWFNISTDRGETFLATDIQASISGADNPGIVADGLGHVYVTYGTLLVDLVRTGRADLSISLNSGPDQATLVRVPPEGGRVSVSGFLHNQTSGTTFIGIVAILDVLRDDGSVLGTVASRTFTLAPGRSKGRTASFRIPQGLAPGLYHCRLSVGNPIDDYVTLCVRKDE